MLTSQVFLNKYLVVQIYIVIFNTGLVLEYVLGDIQGENIHDDYKLEKIHTIVHENVNVNRNGTEFEENFQVLSYGPSGESIRLLDYYQNKKKQCDPSTNIYPCGVLEFLGCTGNKKIYAQSSIRLNWFEAWEFCRAHDLNLASIQSNYEQIFIEIFLSKPDKGATEGYWISGTDFGREGRFFWMNSGQSFTYTNWRIGEPNNFRGQEHCVQLTATTIPNHDNTYMRWNDMPCNLVAYAICQEDYIRE